MMSLLNNLHKNFRRIKRSLTSLMCNHDWVWFATYSDKKPHMMNKKTCKYCGKI